MTARRAPVPAAGGTDDPADALARAELADTTPRPGAGWRPDHGDRLAEGLLVGFHDAPRQRRLALFSADPEAALMGWRLMQAVRAEGADAELGDDGLIRPIGWHRVPHALRDLARHHRDALATWLRLERATGAPTELRRDARPPHGAAEALLAGREWCSCCGPPPAGAVATWFARPGERAWCCATCREPPADDRTTLAYGLSGDPCDPAPAGCAPGWGGSPPRA
jgi:hypothetical protein